MEINVNGLVGLPFSVYCLLFLRVDFCSEEIRVERATSGERIFIIFYKKTN